MKTIKKPNLTHSAAKIVYWQGPATVAWLLVKLLKHLHYEVVGKPNKIALGVGWGTQ